MVNEKRMARATTVAFLRVALRSSLEKRSVMVKYIGTIANGSTITKIAT